MASVSDVEQEDVGGRRLAEALSEKRKEFQQLKNIRGRTIIKRKKDQRKRLVALKVSISVQFSQLFSYLKILFLSQESFKGKKETIKRKKPWSDIEWQNHWNSLDNKQKHNLDRKKSHCHEILNTKIEEMADNYNASIICLIRYPNGTQQSKYVLTSGGGIKYLKSDDGNLKNQLWERHWNKKQSQLLSEIVKMIY